MPYCTVAEVKAAINFPTTGAPVEDSSIAEFILDAQDEIENIYHTKFGNVEDSGTADGDFSTTTFSDSTKAWTVDEYIGGVIWINGGTGEGQYRDITDNDATKITVSPAFDTAPDGTSTYKITLLGYKDQTVDGSGSDIQFVEYQPLLNLNYLEIDSTEITTSNVYTDSSGEMILSSSAEASVFSANQHRLVNVKYIYGVYPMPRIIKRLCVLLAGIKTMVSQIAGTYNDWTSVSLPHLSGSLGEPYTNIREAVQRAQTEVKNIIERYRPFTYFA